jgi:hypothetical protein
MSSPRRGAIVGMARSKPVTGDLAKAVSSNTRTFRSAAIACGEGNMARF